MYQVQELPELPETLSQKKKKDKQNRRGLGAGDESVGKVPAEQRLRLFGTLLQSAALIGGDRASQKLARQPDNQLVSSRSSERLSQK